MIDEKQLIEDFKNTFSDSVLNQTFGFGKYTFLEAIEEMINRQPQIVTDTNVGSKWIPCSERLPSAGRKVLLQTKGNQMVVAFLDKKNKWYVDSGDYFCTDLCAEPIAWQPLPESYKE